MSPPPKRLACCVLSALIVVGCATTKVAPPTAPSVAPAPPSSTTSVAQPIAPSLGAGCDAPDYAAAADYNRAAETDLAISPFGRPEAGWAIYGPQIAEAVATPCAPEDAGFAKAVADWQAAHGLTPTGAVTVETLQTLKGVWQERRPFVMLRVAGICPAGADETTLAALQPDETFGDKTVLLRSQALAALRRMIAAARRDLPEAQGEPSLLTAFSGYRSPVADAARCEAEHNCQGMVRAECSVHRTGLAVDLNVGYAPGFMADSSADANRLVQSRSAVYRWLVRNAADFGFVNYVFEPWHWEWTGDLP